MTAIVSGVFTRPVFGPDQGAADRQKAAAGFTQIFHLDGCQADAPGADRNWQRAAWDRRRRERRNLRRVFRPGAREDARGSRAMAPMRKLVAHSLGRPGAQESALAKEARANSAGDLHAVIDGLSGTSRAAPFLPQSETVELQFVQPGDNRGPQLLPPAPSPVAPVLPPPKG